MVSVEQGVPLVPQMFSVQWQVVLVVGCLTYVEAKFTDQRQASIFCVLESKA